MKKIYLLLFALLALSAKAQTVNPVPTAVPFLRLGPDATAAGKGETGIATLPDVHSIFWNTAKLGFDNDRFGISGSYTPWPSDLFSSNILNHLISNIYLLDVSTFVKLDSLNTLTGSFRYYNYSSITFTNASGQILNTFQPNEYTLHLGYAHKFSKHFSAGLNLGYVYSNLAAGQSINGVPIKAGASIMGDVSLFYTHPLKKDAVLKNYNLGLTFTNLGNKMTYTESAVNKDFLPANLGLGGALHFQMGGVHNITLSVDLNKLLIPSILNDSTGNYRIMSVPSGILHSFSSGEAITYAAGIEYGYKNIIMLRTGLFNESTGTHYFTVGAGLRVAIVEFEVSYVIPLSTYLPAYYSPFFYSSPELQQATGPYNVFRFSLSFFIPEKHS